MATDSSLSRNLMILCFGGAIALSVVLRPPASTPSAKPSNETKLEVLSAADATQMTTPNVNTSNFKLVVDLSDRQVYVYSANKLKAKYPVAIGQRGWETPNGTFQVITKDRNPAWRHPITGELVLSGPNNPLGDRWIGFWSDGKRQFGFHGTNKQRLVGQAVSHGCLRMRNADIRAMYSQVSKGTPVIIRK